MDNIGRTMHNYMEKNPTIDNRWEVPVSQDNHFARVPQELMKIIFQSINIYDLIMLRSSCKSFFNLVFELHLFPKNFVLAQEACAKYFVTLGSRSCLQYLKSLNFFFTSVLAAAAVETNNLEMLKQENSFRLNQFAVLNSMRVGNLDMVKYCLEHSPKGNVLNSYESLFSAEAAINGHLHVLKYLHENGYPWTDYTTQMAAFKNQVECLKYAVEQGCPIPNQIRCGGLEALNYLKQRGVDWTPEACSSAASQGKLDVLKWAHENGAPWGMAVMQAIWIGHLDCLEYMLAQGAHIGQTVKNVGTLDVLKYLWEHCDRELLSEQIYCSAVENLERGMVEYLVTNTTINKPPSLATLAVYAGDFELAKWCIEDLKFGTAPHTYEDEYESIDILEAALSTNNLDIAKYVITNNLGPRLRTHTVYVENGMSNSMSAGVWKLMYEVEPFEFTATMMQSVVQQGNIETIEWMIEKAAKFTNAHLTHAAQYNQLTTIAYLLKIGCKFTAGCPFGNWLCYKYAHEHGYKWPLDKIEGVFDNVELLRYMVHCGHITLNAELYKKARKHNATQCLAYLEEQGFTSTSLVTKAKNLFSSIFK